MNTNTLSAACVGLALGGALAEALEGIYALATGTAAIGGALGVLHGVLSHRRRRSQRDALAWGDEQHADWQATGLVDGAIGAVCGLVLGILDAVIAA
jgi:hypothetical protein